MTKKMVTGKMIKEITKRAMYEDFAFVYDRMMGDVDYLAWANYIENLFSNYNIKPRDIVDLACGTGNITTLMAERGYRMMGIDNSQDMLLVAQEKARKKGLKIPFVCQDMREVELLKEVDAVLINCDGINYITDEADLDTVFSGIYRILKPGGVFLFDISSYYKLSSILGNNIMVDDDQDISLIWQNSFDDQENICIMDLSFFIREGSVYRRFDETHIQKAHKEQDIIEKLKQNGFENINCFHHLTFDSPKELDERILFGAQRNT